jgi:hypothetical protein
MAKGIPVTLHGQKHHLLLTTNGLARFEAMTGKMLMAKSTADHFTLWDLIVMIRSLLLDEDPNLDVRDAASLIDTADLGALMNAVPQAIANYTAEITK